MRIYMYTDNWLLVVDLNVVLNACFFRDCDLCSYSILI